MSAATTAPMPLLDGEASRLLDDFTVSQAAELAREGAYDRAESLLRPSLERPDAPLAALDLQARVCAQQGRLGEAAQWWQKVLEREPSSLAAQAALTRARALQRRPVWLQTLWPLLVGVGVLACVAIGPAWQAHRQAAADATLLDRIAQVVEIEAQSGRRQSESLRAEVIALKSAHAQAGEHVNKLGEFSVKLGGWTAAQDAMSEQLAELQVAARRLASQQESLAQSASNQVNTLRRTFEQELAAATAGFAKQLDMLRKEASNLASQHNTRAQALSNHVLALREAVDRERALTAEIEQSRAATEKLWSDYRALESRHALLVEQIGIAAKRPGVFVDVPGVTASVSGSEIIVRFDDGVFDHGTHFKPGAKDRLLAVAKALSGSTEPLQIQVVGFADDDRAFLKWTAQWEAALALDRASTVVEHFLTLGVLQPRQLMAVIGDNRQRPFASDSDRNRLKNRTILLRLKRSPSSKMSDSGPVEQNHQTNH